MAGNMFRLPVVILKRLMYTKVKITFGISVAVGQTEIPVAALQIACRYKLRVTTNCVSLQILKTKQTWLLVVDINLLAPELFFLNFSTPCI